MTNSNIDKTEKRQKNVRAVAGWAIFHTIQFGYWAFSALSAERVGGRVFSSVLAFSLGTMATITWAEAIALWKNRRNQQKQ